jgi:hypothetical protein
MQPLAGDRWRRAAGRRSTRLAAAVAAQPLRRIRTPATLRSDAAFIAANRMAAPPILAAGVIYAAAGGLALGTDGPALTTAIRSNIVAPLAVTVAAY